MRLSLANLVHPLHRQRGYEFSFCYVPSKINWPIAISLRLIYAGVNSPPRPPRLLSDMCIACVKYMCYEFDGHTCAWLIWLLEAKGRGCCSCSLVKPYDKIYGSIFSMFLFMSLNVTFVTRPSDVRYATTSMIEYPYCLPPQRNSIIV